MGSGKEPIPVADQAVLIMLPTGLRQQLEKLNNLKPSIGGGQGNTDWKELVGNPDILWQTLKPLLETHDDICRQFEDIQLPSIPGIASVSKMIDGAIFRLLAPTLKPLIGSIREYLEGQRKDLAAKEKEAARDPSADIFGVNSTATNPTHTMLAKDHFDCILNNPAGKLRTLSLSQEIY
jgi:hypothetical protein